MAKTISLNIPVYKLVKENPDIVPVLKELGFNKITDPVALNTIGRTVTLAQGAGIMQVPMDKITAALKAHGFEVENDRADQLKQLLSRLNDGEDLEAVKADFVKDFESVTVTEIMNAEQQLMNDGVPESEIQNLCDLHSALFHGKTEAEILAEERMQFAEDDYLIQLLMAENRQLEKRISALNFELKKDQPDFNDVKAKLEELKELKKHYAKKEELIMPFLYDAGITGPSTVMWGVDDEILKDTSKIAKLLTPENLAEYKKPILRTLQRMAEMIYKEEKILFPMALEHLTEEAWLQTYGDIAEYGLAWLDHQPKWEKGEQYLKDFPYNPADLNVAFPTGNLAVEQMVRLFDTLPIDITYIDENDDLIFFTNEGHVFARPKSALGRKVYGCHPPRVVPIVKNMLDDFKAKKRDRVERWLPNPEKPVKVVYQAVYDENGDYKGTIEMVQSFENEKETLKKFMK